MKNALNFTENIVKGLKKQITSAGFFCDVAARSLWLAEWSILIDGLNGRLSSGMLEEIEKSKKNIFFLKKSVCMTGYV